MHACMATLRGVSPAQGLTSPDTQLCLVCLQGILLGGLKTDKQKQACVSRSYHLRI